MKITIKRKIKNNPDEIITKEHEGKMFPYYVNCISMEILKDEIIFNVLGEHRFQLTNNKLWLLGKFENKATINEHIELE